MEKTFLEFSFNKNPYMLPDVKFQLCFIFVGCRMWHMLKGDVKHPSVDCLVGYLAVG
jgi:hypothetical protein